MSTEDALSQTSRQFNILSAVFAFIIWGGWAYYINSSHGVSTGIVSGFTQGTASFIITLLMVRAVTWLAQRIKNHSLKLILPAVITVSFTGCCLAIIQSLVGTPAIPGTIAPALTVAFLFCVFTAFKLRSLNANKE